MKNSPIQDERILLTGRKIRSGAYGVLEWMLAISIIVQRFFMNAPFSQYAVELFALIGGGLYISIRHFKEGIDIWQPKGDGQKKTILNTMIVGVVSIIVFAGLSGQYDIKSLTTYLICFVLFFVVFRSAIIFVNNKNQQAIENKLNEDEMNE